jgi:hypothetical protein
LGHPRWISSCLSRWWSTISNAARRSRKIAVVRIPVKRRWWTTAALVITE